MNAGGREREEECVRAFMEWYGAELGDEYTLDEIPDKTVTGGIDAVLHAADGSLVYVEHTSIEEFKMLVPGRKKARIVKEREASTYLARFRARFREAGPLPHTGKIAVLRIPAHVVMSDDSATSAVVLRRWFEQHSKMLPDDNRCYPTNRYPGPIPIASLPFGGMSYASHSSSHMPDDVIIRLLGVEETDLEEELKYVLDTNVRKVSEFTRPSDTDPIRRLLIIQNDQWGRCFKSSYIPFIQVIASGRNMGDCDEIWAFEMQSDKIELAPVLLWCRDFGDERGRYQYFDPPVVKERHEAWRHVRQDVQKRPRAGVHQEGA